MGIAPVEQENFQPRGIPPSRSQIIGVDRRRGQRATHFQTVGFKADASLFKRWTSGYSSAASGLGWEISPAGVAKQFVLDNGVETGQSARVWVLVGDGVLRIAPPVASSLSTTREWLLLSRQGSTMTVIERQLRSNQVVIEWRINVYAAGS